MEEPRQGDSTESQDGKVWFWVSVGIGVAGLAAITGLVVQYYQQQKRLLESVDPRALQVRELIDEAEQLLAVGRRGGSLLRRARV